MYLNEKLKLNFQTSRQESQDEEIFFISLKWKLVLAIGAILILVNGFIALITYNNLNAQFILQQNENLEIQSRESQKQIEQIYQRLTDFGELVPLLSGDNANLIQISDAIGKHFANFQITFDIRSAKLLSPRNMLISRWGAPFEIFTDNLFQQVKEQQQPVRALYCQLECFFLLASPILSEEGDIAVLIVNHSVADWLLNLKVASGAETGILTRYNSSTPVFVTHTDQRRLNNWNSKIIGLTRAKTNYPILEGLSQRASLKSALEQNNFVQEQQSELSIQFLPLRTYENDSQTHLILINDISESREQIRKSVFQAIITALVGVVAASLFIVLAMWSPIRHLTLFSKTLPLLAKGRFGQTKEQLKSVGEKRLIKDELDTLKNSAISLTEQLEKLEEEVKVREQALSKNAMFDSLTDLANRRLFMERVSNAIAISKRKNTPFAVLFLDLDQFKKINDSLGHEQGDNLLIQVAERLRGSVRESDTVARLGGDEFTILLNQLEDGYDATSIALKLLDSMRHPIDLNGRLVTVTTSIGIAVSPENGDDPETLLRNADLAMYKAKGMGRDNYHYYTASMNIEAQNLLALENELRAAVENDEFVLYYQPQFDLESRVIIGVEALLRWQSPSRGLVAPYIFMDALEDTGLIVTLGEKILRLACKQAKEWNSLNIHELRVAVNLSARQFNDPNLVSCIQKVLIEEKLESRFLELEITESMLMNDIDDTIETLHMLKNLGLALSIDDFGTGYSSLSYLKQFPVDTLKVDRAFVKDIPNNQSDMAIASAVIAMAHKLNLSVVAEGIETEEQLEFLKSNTCEIGQGYLFGKPQPAEDITNFLRNSNLCVIDSKL